MSNLSHSRFQDTLRDLVECQDHLDDPLSDEEERARQHLIRVCREISESEEGRRWERPRPRIGPDRG